MSKIIPYETTAKLTLRQRKWLDSYLTCFNMTQASREAGYKNDNENTLGVVGSQNYKKLKYIIDKWVDENLLSDELIKKKIHDGLEAKETKFFAHQGEVIEEREVEAHHIQAKYADMAAKVKGIYAAEKRDVLIETYEERVKRLLEASQ